MKTEKEIRDRLKMIDDLIELQIKLEMKCRITLAFKTVLDWVLDEEI